MCSRVMIWFFWHPIIFFLAGSFLVIISSLIIWREISKRVSVDSPEAIFVKEKTDHYLARYSFINQEITRYRDLASGKCAYIAIGLYAGILLANNNFHYGLTMHVLKGLIILIAIVSTTLHFFTESRILFNQILRRELEKWLGMMPPFAHEAKNEKPFRWASIVSIIIIELFIWLPMLAMVFYWKPETLFTT